MKCCRFGFTSCSSSYLYILFSALLYFLKSSLISFSELSFKKTTNIFGIEPVIFRHGLIKLMFEYLGSVIFGGIFYYIFTVSKYYKRKKEENLEINKNLLFFKKKYLSFRKIKLLLITCLLYSVQLVIRYIMYILLLWPLDLWIFNIIFICFFMKLIFKIEIYRHQLYSLGFNFIINLILLIVASSINVNNKTEYHDIANNFGNYFYIVLFYLVFLVLSAMICSSQVLQKKLMDVENVSPFTIIFTIGVLNTLFIIIALIIATTVKCNEELAKKGFCQTDSNVKYSYFDSFIIFKNNMSYQYLINKSAFFIEIFLVYPFYSFVSYIKFFCDVMIICRLNPIYILISDNTYFSVKMIIGLINTPSDICSYLKLIGELISLFTYFVYLEIIELKCCNMNFNTRIHINERSIVESRGSIGFEDDEDDILVFNTYYSDNNNINNNNINNNNIKNDGDNDNGRFSGSEMVNMTEKDNESNDLVIN